jgi:hypothetical protein
MTTPGETPEQARGRVEREKVERQYRVLNMSVQDHINEAARMTATGSPHYSDLGYVAHVVEINTQLLWAIAKQGEEAAGRTRPRPMPPPPIAPPA